ncbi:MAG: ABC transporter permease [Candidatus Bathyarchaeota archaeon]|nr:ABC transporter permease [Candidatus Bathyarchaeota archaeon]
MTETWALTVRELKKWIRTPATVFIALFQPIVWLALFGSAFNPTNLIPVSIGPTNLTPEVLAQIRQSILSQTFGNAPNYITYLTGGILSLLLLFTSAFSGGSLVLDRRFGYLNKLLVSPIPRASIFLSRVFATVVKGMIPSLIVFFVALSIPDGLKLDPSFSLLDGLLLFLTLFLLSLGFSSLFTAIAIRMTKWESLVAVVNLLNLPLLFSSSALLPVTSMPDWLQAIAKINPISKAADVTRTLIVQGSVDLSSMMFDMTYLIAFAAILTIAGGIASVIALRTE